MKNIILIGMPGCGKSTIGKILAKKLNMKLFDCDSVFEKTFNIKTSDFFAIHGEEAFRDEETNLLSSLVKQNGVIISTGGGCVERDENKDILQNGGTVIFINRPVEVIHRNIRTTFRPLLAKDKNKLFELYDRRFSKYKDFCHTEIENTGTLMSTVHKIIDEVIKNENYGS